MSYHELLIYKNNNMFFYIRFINNQTYKHILFNNNNS